MAKLVTRHSSRITEWARTMVRVFFVFGMSVLFFADLMFEMLLKTLEFFEYALDPFLSP